MHILVIEDDPVIGKSLKQGLLDAGHQGTWVKDGARGLEAGRTQQFDAVVLDLLLPGEPGLAVLDRLRREGIRTPVVLLTALGSVEERVAGLRAGADDYVVKPFALAELLARLEAVCRRAADRPPPVLEAGELSLDMTTRRVLCAGKEVELTPTEFSLLEMLLRYAGQVVTRKMLCEHVWEADWEGVTNVIEVHINRLRGKLQRHLSRMLIHTVRGRGYVLRAPAGHDAEPALPPDGLEHGGGAADGPGDAAGRP
jgi:two-component system OmpR family response regulator/two-component system copper resistance phosphate regulon response regulator CusR